MSQLDHETDPEGRLGRIISNAILARTPISTSLDFSSHTEDGQNISAKMARSPSRPRTATESEAPKSQRTKPDFSSLPSRKPSANQYMLYSSYEESGLGQSPRSASKPRYDGIDGGSNSNGDLDSQQEAIRTPLSELGSTSSKVFQYPEVLISVRLERDHFLSSDEDDEKMQQLLLETLRNLSGATEEAMTGVKIQDICKGFSTLLILSIPIALWNLIRENPAFSFIGFVNTSNLTLQSTTKRECLVVPAAAPRAIEETTKRKIVMTEHHQLTPSNNIISECNDDEFQNPPTFGSSCSKAWWKPEEPPSYPHQGSEVDEEADSKIKMDSSEPKPTFAGFLTDEDDELDDEESSFESEEDSFEQRWIPTDEGLETSVLRATGNNLSLAARLIPPLHEMFQREKSSVVGFWEPWYRQKAGDSYDQDSGEQGDGGELLSSYTDRHANNRKRQRENDEENGQGADKNQDRDKDGDAGSNEGSSGGSCNSRLFACPFNKRYPSMYNGLYRSPSARKGEYKTCESGFDTEQRFREHLDRIHRCVQCEKCSRKFTAPQKQRKVDFQKHLSNGECGNAPPPLLEGLTELQWAEIQALPSRRRSASSNGKPKLTLIRWNRFWKIIFPGENPPMPWCIAVTTPNEPLSSTLEEDLTEFEMCYDAAMLGINEDLDSRDKAAHAFRFWWTKRDVEKQQALRRPQQEVQQTVFEENAAIQPAWSENGWSNRKVTFPNQYPAQRRDEMRGFPSNQQFLQNTPNRQNLQDIFSTPRRTLTDPDFSNQAYRALPVSPQHPTTEPGPNVTQALGQLTTYQLGYPDPKISYPGSIQQPNAFSQTSSLALESQSVNPLDFDDITDFSSNSAGHGQYGVNGAFDINGAPQSQQTSPASHPAQSYHPLYNTNQIQQHNIQQPQGYVPPSGITHNAVSAYQPTHPQQDAIPYRSPNPDRDVQTGAPNFHDPYAEQDAYSRD